MSRPLNPKTKTAVLGVPVDALSFAGAQDRVLAWGQAHESRYVVLANVHVVVTASTEPDFGAVVAAADMATPHCLDAAQAGPRWAGPSAGQI